MRAASGFENEVEGVLKNPRNFEVRTRAINLTILEDSRIILKNWLMADIGDTGAWEAIKNRGCIHSI